MDEYNTAFTFSICFHITLTFPVVFEYHFVKLYINITCFSDYEKQTNILKKSLLQLAFLVLFWFIPF